MYYFGSIIAWIAIILLFFDVRWKGKVAVFLATVFSFLLPTLVSEASPRLMHAIGNAIRIVLFCIYLARLNYRIVRGRIDIWK